MLRFMIRLHSILNCVRHTFSYITNVDEIYDFSFQNKEETTISMILHILCILVQFAIMMNKYQLHFVICYINPLSRSVYYGHQSFTIFRDDPSIITHMMYIATRICILASLWPRTRATFRRVSRSSKLLISQNARSTVAFFELHFGYDPAAKASAQTELWRSIIKGLQVLASDKYHVHTIHNIGYIINTCMAGPTHANFCK